MASSGAKRWRGEAMISIKCPHCGNTLNIPDQYAGQTGKCKECGNQIIVPIPCQPPPAPAFDVCADIQAKLEDAEQNRVSKKPAVISNYGPPPGATSATNDNIKKGCLGCLGLLVLFVILGAIGDRINPAPATRHAVTTKTTHSPTPIEPGDRPIQKIKKSGITYENFTRISNGMTYEQVVYILGEPGKEQGRNSLGQGTQFAVETVMYYWNGGGMKGITCMFQNGSLMQKNQLGLE